ncbi:synaptonemal complex protein 1-like isoform X2 [Mytilus californianus]|nr:synaptonemal complex protein 1-like isoform X2 [Mytilus californianus]
MSWTALKSNNIDDDGLSTYSCSDERIHGLSYGSQTSLINPGVMGVLERLQEFKGTRLQSDLHHELQEIRHRVNQALKNVDFMFEDNDDKKDETKFPSIVEDIQSRELERQKEVNELISGMVEGSEITQGLLVDVDEWFHEVRIMALDKGVDEEFEKFVKSTDITKTDVMKSLKEFGDASQKMVKLGNRVLKEAGNIIKENETEAKKMKLKAKEKITIYDEHELMVDAAKWDRAVKMIINTFDDALKSTRNAAYKSIYTKALKQFRYLASAMSKKILDLNAKQREVNDLKKKLLDAKAAVEKKHQEAEELKKNIRRMTREVEEKAKLIESQEKRNQELTKKLMGAEQKSKGMEKEILDKEASAKQELLKKEAELAKAAEPPPPPPDVPPKKVIIKVVDPELVQKVKDTEEQLEKSKIQISNNVERIKELERQMMKEKEKIKQLKDDLEKAEKEAEEAAMTINIAEPVIEIPEVQTTESVPADKDSAYFKKLLTGMKRDFSQELEKLKAHLRKEKQRSTAAVKRCENAHKDHLSAIQKDVIRVLRAIMHFRDHMCTLMEKENLKDLVYSLQKLKNLIPDQLVPDPKELLTMLVANVVEYMHNMELIISNAFLAMRMMIKGTMQHQYEPRTSDRQTEIRVKVKDAETRMKTMDTAKTETIHIARRLQVAKDRLEKFEQMTLTEEQAKDKKYHGLLNRYHMVWQMYNKLQKDMDILQGDFQTSIEEKIKEQEDFVIPNIKMELKQRKADPEIELKLTLADQKQNLQILEKAHDDNKISKDMYMMASALLKKALRIPGKRIKYFFEQYIAFRSVQDSRERLQGILEEPELASDVRKDIEDYIKRMESKMDTNMEVWNERMRNLEEERKQIHQNIWKLFNEVLAETGVLLVHPLFQRNKVTGQVYSQMAQTIKRDALKKLLRKRQRMTHLLKLPPVCVGSSMVSKLQPQPPSWKGVGQGDNPPAKVNTPYTQHYDVNKSRIDAERVLKDEDKGRHAYPLAKIQKYFINPSQTTVST